MQAEKTGKYKIRAHLEKVDLENQHEKKVTK